MSYLKRRLEKMEKKLRMEQSVEDHIIIVKMVEADGTSLTLPEPIEDWLTYKEEMNKPAHNGNRVIVLYPEEELKARERLQKVT